MDRHISYVNNKGIQILGTVIFCTLLFPSNSFSQLREIEEMTRRVTINYADHTAEIAVIDKKLPLICDDCVYFWYKSSHILQTRGGYEGKLLHGWYTDFYFNKNLREKGKFRNGLKKGKWMSWYDNGEYKEVSKWRKGKKQGPFITYDNQGKVLQKGKYCNDLLSGKVYTQVNSDSTVVERYKQGELLLISKKEKGEKEKVKSEKEKGEKGKKEKVKSEKGKKEELAPGTPSTEPIITPNN